MVRALRYGWGGLPIDPRDLVERDEQRDRVLRDFRALGRIQPILSGNLPPAAPAGPPQPFEGNFPRPRPLNALEQLRAQQERDSKFRVRSVPLDEFNITPEGGVLPPGPTSWTDDPQATTSTYDPETQGTTTMAGMSPEAMRRERDRIYERMRSGDLDVRTGVRELRDLGVDVAGRPLQTYEQAAGARVPGGMPQKGFLPPRPSPFEGDYPPGWSQQGTELEDALARRARRFTEDPGFGKETEAERAARRAAQDAAYQQQSLASPGYPGVGQPLAGLPQPRTERGPNPIVGDPYTPPSTRGLPPNPGDPYTPRSVRGPNPIPGDPYTPLAGPPEPFAAFPPRPEGPAAGLSQMTPNIPPARPPGPPSPYSIGAGMTPGDFGQAPQARPPELGPPAPTPFTGNMPQPRPNTDARFAMLPNGPREWSLGIQTPGGQQSRLPQNRPPLLTDGPPSPLAIDPAQRITSAFPPSPSPAQPAPAAFAPAGVPTGQNLLTPDMDPAGPPPPFGTMIAPAIDPTQAATRGLPQQVPPDRGSVLAREEARRTLQLHPDTGRIPTAPGLQQFNEPASTPFQPDTRPLIRPDLTEAAANFKQAPLPRARPDYNPEAMGSDVPADYDPLSSIRAPAPAAAGPIMRADSGLPETAMASIRSSYDPTAMGGPTTPETPAEARARQALIDKLNAGSDVIAEPPEATVPPVPSPAPTIDETVYGGAANGPPDPLAAAGLQYQGPTAQSRFGGNIFQRIGTPHERHIGGPGLMAPLDPAKQDFPKAGGGYYVNKDKTERGERKFAEHEKRGRRIGMGVGAGAGMVLGGVPGAAVLGPFGRMVGGAVERGIDPNRSILERFFGNRDGKKKNRSKDEIAREIEAMQREQQRRDSMSRDGSGTLGGGGMGGIFGGGTFGGYGMGGGYGGSGGRYINEGVGGAYRNR